MRPTYQYPITALALALALMTAPPTSAAADDAGEPIETESQALEAVLEPFGEVQGDDEAGEPTPAPTHVDSFEGEAQPRTTEVVREQAVPEVDECDWRLQDRELQEQSQEVLRSWSCHSFRWFDSLFGDERDFNEKGVNGLVTVGANYSEYFGLQGRLRFRVRAALPNLDRRWDLILGRVDEEAFVSDTQAQDGTFYNPGVVERDEDTSWLLGLGHRRGDRKSGWDYSLGVRLRLPPRPYAKLQYFHNKQFSEDTDLRFRQTFFWRSDQGFGTTSRGDLSHALDVKNVLRWEAVGTISEETEGTEWYFGQTWYHLFSGQSAFSLLSFVRGETSAPVELREYGLNFIWRRPFTRDWLFLSLGPSVTWPRYLPEEKREASLGFGVWIEMAFGDWRY